MADTKNPRKIDFLNRDIISINDFSRQEIEYILKIAEKIEKMPESKKLKLLAGKVLGTLFFEPSTRTRLSFETAMQHLGGSVLGFAKAQTSSASKGETTADTVKMVEAYTDVVVLRHSLEGSARVGAEASKNPIINGGDGANQHPTQTLLDMYTIKKTQGKLDGLKVALVGDLKYGRTVHSLAIALSFFGCKLYFVAPKLLPMPKSICDVLKERKIKYSVHERIEEVIKEVDILYMTRIQKERFGDPLEYEKVKDVYVLKKAMLEGVKKNMKVLHPLPRVNEIETEVDDTPHAYYFQQGANGVPIRQAVLALVLGKIK